MTPTGAAGIQDGTVRPLAFTTHDLLPSFARALSKPLDAITGLATLRRMYLGTAGAVDFLTTALQTLDIGVTVADDDLARVPEEGPLIVVANHPHGAADGLAVAQALRRVRQDVKLLGNELLARLPEMRDHLIIVDAFRSGRNGAAVRAAVEWVRQGHALVVFPAGSVSHVAAGDGRVVDAPWREGVARIASQAQAPVLPLFIEGRNSRVFLGAGLLHPLLRTVLLPRELLRQRGSRVTLHIGPVVSTRRLMSLGDTATQIAYLRVRCYGLAHGTRTGALRVLRRPSSPAPLAPAVSPHRLAAEIDALSESALLESGPWQVVCAEADDIPLTLQEIGRLRELTFRDVGEGTGRPRDLDRYDRHYRHLFVWHRVRRSIVGAYRVGPTDRIVGRQGARGLYTRSLFRYPRRLLEELGPALELGRSFVQPEFQRDYQPLLLLWRGIGRLVAREPRYRRLFGPVSISAEYGVVTRQILARFLLANRYSANLGTLVRPRRPLVESPHDAPDALVRSSVATRLDQVDEIVRELELEQRGLPVLLRQYLKLNAKLLGFSVDPAFGHVLDGLVVVDLLDVDHALLARYLGREGAATFRAWHRQPAVVTDTRTVVEAAAL